MIERIGEDLTNMPSRIEAEPAVMPSTGVAGYPFQVGASGLGAFAGLLEKAVQSAISTGSTHPMGGLNGRQESDAGGMGGEPSGDAPFAPLPADAPFTRSSSPTLRALLGTDPDRIPWPSQVSEGAKEPRSREERIDPSTSFRVEKRLQVFLHSLATLLEEPSAPPLSQFPRPAGDNGRGMHWIPTVSQSQGVVDRFVRELQEMKIKWAVILNEGADTERNDYLVERLTQAGIMPVMRIYTAGLNPIPPEDLEAAVRHYRDKGVHYFQLYNEPNLRFENGGRDPDVGRYLDLWVPAARAVVRAGGLPGFGALSPGGEMDDLQFLRTALQELKKRGQVDVLDQAWLSVHNYDSGDGKGFFRYRRYADIIQDELGRQMPMVGTEGGIYPGGDFTVQDQVERVRQSYAHMAQREPDFLAYSYWIVANEAGGGHDKAFSHQALFRPDGVSPIVDALKST